MLRALASVTDSVLVDWRNSATGTLTNSPAYLKAHPGGLWNNSYGAVTVGF